MATSDSPPAPSTPPSEVPTPKFDRKFKPNEQIFYFYHVIDAEKATLQSLILGPNVSNTFSHAQAAHTILRLTLKPLSPAKQRASSRFSSQAPARPARSSHGRKAATGTTPAGTF
ncbi:hypothetical protein J3459_016041 [Metarhizium acridum]|nr:hypothetical protein J3459_016041 [Metarhizium acridum]